MPLKQLLLTLFLCHPRTRWNSPEFPLSVLRSFKPLHIASWMEKQLKILTCTDTRRAERTQNSPTYEILPQWWEVKIQGFRAECNDQVASSSALTMSSRLDKVTSWDPFQPKLSSGSVSLRDSSSRTWLTVMKPNLPITGKSLRLQESSTFTMQPNFLTIICLRSLLFWGLGFVVLIPKSPFCQAQFRVCHCKFH